MSLFTELRNVTGRAKKLCKERELLESTQASEGLELRELYTLSPLRHCSILLSLTVYPPIYRTVFKGFQNLVLRQSF